MDRCCYLDTTGMSPEAIKEAIVRYLDAGEPSVLVWHDAIEDISDLHDIGGISRANDEAEIMQVAENLATELGLVTGTQDGGMSWWFRRA